MQLEQSRRVQATQDIHRFRTVVAPRGTRGDIVGVTHGQAGTSYTVTFEPTGLSGATVTVEHVDRGQLAGI